MIQSQKEMRRLPEKWEPLLNNLGHTLRKMKQYEESLHFHRQAMVLSPQNSSTYAAIGFVYSLMSQWNEAVECFHKALSLKREDPFSTQMLNLAITQLINSMTPLSGAIAFSFSIPCVPLLSCGTVIADPPPPYESIRGGKDTGRDACKGNKTLASTAVSSSSTATVTASTTVAVAAADVEMDTSGESQRLQHAFTSSPSRLCFHMRHWRSNSLKPWIS